MGNNKKTNLLDSIFKNDSQGVLYPVVLLLIIGTINVYSANSIRNIVDGSNIFGHLKPLAFTLVSLLGGWMAYRIDYRRLKQFEAQILIIGITLLSLTIVALFGITVNGSKRWINLWLFSVQPSEFAKLAAIIWTAFCISQERRLHNMVGLLQRDRRGNIVDIRPRNKNNIFNTLVDLFSFNRLKGKELPIINKAFWIPILYAGFVIKQPDMGTAVLIVAFSALLFSLIEIPNEDKSWRNIMGALVLIGGVLLILIEPYRLDRVKPLLNPWAYSRDIGYQTTQGLMAVGSGGIFGQGIGQGTAKYSYLPEAHTDFAFAVWAQETGLIGCVVLIMLFTLFIRYGLLIAKRSRDGFGSLLAYGITLLIGGQAIFNMIMVCGMLPVTGVPLPFISYGGSAQLMNLIAVGILLNISRHTTLSTRSIGVSGDLPSIREQTRSRFRAPMN